MNAFDILILFILMYCLIRGLFRGLARELSSIVGVFGGFYAAYTYYPNVAAFLSKFILDKAYLNIASFLILFCGIFILISLTGRLITYFLKIAFLGWFDRFCGAVFGGIKGFLIISVLLITFAAFLPRGSPIIKGSLIAPYISLVSEELSRFVPKEMKKKFKGNIKGLKKGWQNQI